MIEKYKKYKRKHNLSEELTPKEIFQVNQGVPFQKIIGFINFDNLKINVNKHVLIPRYETEEVVREALKYIKKDSLVLDLCTGSGYVGLTIKQKTGANVIMSDISDDAIEQAKENANSNNLDVEIIKSNMFENIKEKFDVIISNPPYIPNFIKLDKSVTEHEPLTALYGGEDGNDFYKIIVSEMKKYLKKNGIVILEISKDNSDFLKKQGFEILKDINEHDRIAIFKL